MTTSYQSMNADGYYSLGNTYEQKMMFDEAASCYREAVKIDPNHSLAYARLGFALYNRRQLDEAEVYLKKALRLNPHYDEVYSCLGMIYREKEQFDDAIKYLKTGLDINPESAWLYTNLGVTFQHKGQHEEGYRYLHKALEKNPNIQNPPAKMNGLLGDDNEDIVKPISSKNERSKKILIVVSAFNRKRITAMSLKQTRRYKTPRSHLQVYNDQSTEYGNSFLSSYADEVIELPEKLGIDKLRWYQFRKFLDTEFEYLYLTDNDVIHDPHYVSMLDKLYEKGKGKLPVSLFNSIFTSRPHMVLCFRNRLFLKTTAPGISMFCDKQMVQKIMSISEKMGNAFDYLPWDNRAVAFLGLPWITPEISYLEHFGSSGINNENYERDRAINPTEYLQGIRDIILKYLRQKDGDEPEL